MPDREKLRALTPEQRMRRAVELARSEAERRGDHQRADIIAHGAAAIEAALAEQRARIVAFFHECSDDMAEWAIRLKADEAWAERTGWKMEETGDV